VFALLPWARDLYYRQRRRLFASPPPLPDWIRRLAAACWDVRAMQVLEVETTGLPLLLRSEDRSSMTFAIETRLPFLDYRLVEKSIALASGLKIRDGWTKFVLRRAMSDVLPAEIAWRRNKIAFEAPTAMWLARHRDIMAEQVRGSPLLRRICDLDRVVCRFRGLDWKVQWRLYSLALWAETFAIEGLN